MEIIWHGQTCFTLKGTSATVVTDPYDGIGLTLPSLKANVVTLGLDKKGFSNWKAVAGDPKVLDWPGEYEAAGVLVMALEAEGGKRVLHFQLDGIRIVHLGMLDKKLTEEMIEQLGDIDIALIPVGGGEALDAKLAHEVIEQLEPRVVIPMNYNVEGLEADVAPVGNFLKEVGGHMEPLDKFVLKGRAGLPEETTQYVVLNPQLG